MKRNKRFFVFQLISIVLLLTITTVVASESNDATTFNARFNDAYQNLHSMDWKEFLRRNGWHYPWLCLPCLPCVLCAKKGQEKELRNFCHKLNAYQTDQSL